MPEGELNRIRALAYERIRSTGSVGNMEDSITTILEDIRCQVQHIDITGYSPKVQLAVGYIHQNYNDCNLSLKTLADRLDVNTAYLGRQFSLETGVFFSDYLNTLRVKHAKRLLNTTTHKISDIAEQVGFFNVPYFYTIYKKITGERPSNSRRPSVEELT